MTATPLAAAPARPFSLPGQRSWRGVDALEAVPPCRQDALELPYPPYPTKVARPGTDPSLTTGPRDETAPGQVHAWAIALVQAVMEVIAGDRPATQLSRWTNRAVFLEITQRQRRTAARRARGMRHPRHQVATVHVCRPNRRCAEVAARVVLGDRSRALALRLDYLSDRWVCSDIRFG